MYNNNNNDNNNIMLLLLLLLSLSLLIGSHIETSIIMTQKSTYS